MEYAILNKEISTQGNGKMIEWMDMDHIYFIIAMFILEKFKKDSSMEKESIFIVMEIHMMVNGNLIKNKDLVFLLINKKINNIKESGLKVAKKAKAYINGKMAINMKEDFWVD